MSRGPVSLPPARRHVEHREFGETLGSRHLRRLPTDRFALQQKRLRRWRIASCVLVFICAALVVVIITG